MPLTLPWSQESCREEFVLLQKGRKDDRKEGKVSPLLFTNQYVGCRGNQTSASCLQMLKHPDAIAMGWGNAQKTPWVNNDLMSGARKTRGRKMKGKWGDQIAPVLPCSAFCDQIFQYHLNCCRIFLKSVDGLGHLHEWHYNIWKSLITYHWSHITDHKIQHSEQALDSHQAIH